MKHRHSSDTNVAKDAIQATARAIVIARDGGCFFRGKLVNDRIHTCNTRTKAGNIILQADHIVTRANAATYSDVRLIVCVCRGLHGWKKWNKERYDAALRAYLPKERIALWDKAEKNRFQPHRKYTYDWKLELAALKQELKQYGTARRTV